MIHLHSPPWHFGAPQIVYLLMISSITLLGLVILLASNLTEKDYLSVDKNKHSFPVTMVATVLYFALLWWGGCKFTGNWVL